MEKVTIKKIYRDIKDTKFGKKTMTSIYVTEYPDVRMSSFDKGLETWKEGDTVDVTITKNGEYTNFTSKTASRLGAVNSDIIKRIEKLEEAVFNSASGEDKSEVGEPLDESDEEEVW